MTCAGWKILMSRSGGKEKAKKDTCRPDTRWDYHYSRERCTLKAGRLWSSVEEMLRGRVRTGIVSTCSADWVGDRQKNRGYRWMGQCNSTFEKWAAEHPLTTAYDAGFFFPALAKVVTGMQGLNNSRLYLSIERLSVHVYLTIRRR